MNPPKSGKRLLLWAIPQELFVILEVARAASEKREVSLVESVRGCGTHVVASEVVDGSLGQHAVVLEFTLSQGRSVASNDDQLGLAGSQRLEGRLVSESDWQKSC